MEQKRITVFCGHYGSGKTNIAVNYALWLRQSHARVSIIDLDIVNPYFRTKDAEEKQFLHHQWKQKSAAKSMLNSRAQQEVSDAQFLKL